jgi:adenylate cyclase
VLVGICGLKPSLRSLFGFLGVVFAFLLPLGLFIFTQVFLAPLSAILAMALAVIVRELVAFVSSEREKRFIRQAFSTYLSAGVVAELIADPSKLDLGGEKREMTAVFTDVASFSTLSEKLDPSSLVKLLNRYLTVMSDIVMENQGTIDKYEGDAIIAFFGAPLRREDHAALACRSALKMNRAEKELNEQIIPEGLSPTPLFTRIGVNTGDMVVGNMGSQNKMDYTIMGNAVNLASRLEGVNKQYQTGIIVSEYTKAQAGDGFLYRQLDRVRVVGIQKPVLIFELAGIAEEADQNELLFCQTWNEAISLFDQRRFAEAADLFGDLAKQHPADSVTALYVKRSLDFVREPPAPDWDGVFKFTEK